MNLSVMDNVGIVYMLKGVLAYLWVTISENIITKFLVGTFLGIIGAIYAPEHKYMIRLMVVLYLMDFIL